METMTDRKHPTGVVRLHRVVPDHGVVCKELYLDEGSAGKRQYQSLCACQRVETVTKSRVLKSMHSCFINPLIQ
jgi:hypothetical protein